MILLNLFIIKTEDLKKIFFMFCYMKRIIKVQTLKIKISILSELLIFL
jgi:hypothetical protein